MMAHYRAEAKRRLARPPDQPGGPRYFWFSRVFKYINREDEGPGELVFRGTAPHLRKGDATREALAWCMGQPDVQKSAKENA